MITAPFAKHCMNRSVHLNDFNDGPWAKDIITPHSQTQHLKGPTCVLLIACVCVRMRVGMSECDLWSPLFANHWRECVNVLYYPESREICEQWLLTSGKFPWKPSSRDGERADSACGPPVRGCEVLHFPQGWVPVKGVSRCLLPLANYVKHYLIPAANFLGSASPLTHRFEPFILHNERYD